MSYKARSLSQKDLFCLKESLRLIQTGLKRLIQTRGNICVMLSKRRRGFSNAGVLMQPCQVDPVFLCESKSTLFGLMKVDPIRNHCQDLTNNNEHTP